MPTAAGRRRQRSAACRSSPRSYPVHPDAASSLKEGLDETLSLTGLGLPDWLERTLSSTNSIENVSGRMRAILRKVKRWRDGSMSKRWVATAAIRGDAEQINRVDHDEAAA